MQQLFSKIYYFIFIFVISTYPDLLMNEWIRKTTCARREPERQLSPTETRGVRRFVLMRVGVEVDWLHVSNAGAVAIA
jgi:hypothetical protein